MNLFRAENMASDIVRAKYLEGLPYQVETNSGGNQETRWYSYYLVGKTKNFNISIYYEDSGLYGRTISIWVKDYKGVKLQVAKYAMGFFSIIKFPHQKEIIDFINDAKAEIKNATKVENKKEKELKRKKENERLHSLSIKPKETYK